MSNKTKIIFLIIVVVLAVFGVSRLRKDTKSSTSAKSESKNIRLIAAGDFIPHDSVNANAKKTDGGYDYLQFMQDFVPIFKKADIRFCSDPILHGGSKFTISGYPDFNSPTEFVDDMGKLGCNLVATASNHSLDRSQGAIDASVDAWQKVSGKLAVAGQNRNQAEHDDVRYFTTKGVKFAFLSYTTYLNNAAATNNEYGVNIYSRDFAKKQIDKAKQDGADVIVTSMRWGTEYSQDVNEQQKNEAQYLSDQGVALIFGHGPHVLQPVQQLKGSGGNSTQVWYSLGNFLNTQVEPEALFNGLAVIEFDPTTKAITSSKYLPVYMHYEWSAEDKKTEKILARKNLHLYLLDDATDDMVKSNQLDTTIAGQRDRIKNTLNKYTSVPLLSKSEY